MKLFSSFRKDTGGATAVEYGLIAAGIAIAIIAAVNALGTRLDGWLKPAPAKMAPMSPAK